MTKHAEPYLDILPWGLVESGFHAERSRVSESVFSIANETLGLRGYFEEGYSGDTLVGAYSGVLYEVLRTQKSYRGVSDRVCFMPNTFDWLSLRVRANGETLDLARSVFGAFRRELDFRSGLMRRSFVWTCSSGGELELVFERLLSMESPELCYQALSIRSLSFSGSVEIESANDCSPVHEAYGKRFLEPELARKAACPPGASDFRWTLAARTLSTRQGIAAASRSRLSCPGATDSGYFSEPTRSGFLHAFHLEAAQAARLDRTIAVVADRSGAMDPASLCERAERALADDRHSDLGPALRANIAYWNRVWEGSDINIEGREEDQQGIRFCLFQLEQTFRGKRPGANIGAKGLSGEFYNGNYFWDSEVYCLPYYLYTRPEAARALLEFRVRTLDQARARARELDCVGAAYPVATIDGTESCTLWQHASLQLQPTSAVAYGIVHYVEATGDEGFLLEGGLEVLVEIARFFASRAQWSERLGAWGYYGVMGPDEFKMMVNHNAYTNAMGAFSLRAAAKLLEACRVAHPSECAAIEAALALAEGESERWESMAGAMYQGRDEAGLVIEQHAGFFDLPHVDPDSIPSEEFPLYQHWSYDRIYRGDLIKQPDVLMLLFLLNGEFSRAEKAANYDFYEPRCLHESSLSPSIHSILAAELGRVDEAAGFFEFATRVDLDDWNRNAREGLHLTSIAAAWMNIVYGFGGFRSSGGSFSLTPCLPPRWQAYGFKLRLRDARLAVRVDSGGAEVELETPGKLPLRLDLYGQTLTLAASGPRKARVERPQARGA